MTTHLNSNDLEVRESIGHLKANSEITLQLVRELKDNLAESKAETDRRITKLEHGRIKFAGFIVGSVLMVQVFLGDATKALAKYIGVIP